MNNETVLEAIAGIDPDLELLSKRALARPVDRSIIDSRPPLEYLELAVKLGTGLAPPIGRRALEEYLRLNNFDVYSTTSVAKYLNKKVLDMGKWSQWGWFRLRQADSFDNKRPRVGSTIERVYSKRVPIEVLMIVDRIIGDLGAAAQFFVADVVKVPRNKKIDPFLAVSTRLAGCPLYVIERWDEPAYRR